MVRIMRFYRVLNLLSIDIAIGAIACCLFFCKIFSVESKVAGLAALGLTVWIIYTADHLLDARRVKNTAATERHRFHQRYFKILLSAFGAALATDLLLIVYIRKPVFEYGVMLAGTVVFYFLIQRHLSFLKEFFGALLYAGGVLLIPVSVKEGILSADEQILAGSFVMTALINLLLYSWFDHDQDKRDQNTSFTTTVGPRTAARVVISTQFVNGLLLMHLLFNSTLTYEVLTLLVMNLVLAIIFTQKKHFASDDRYRLLGDVVFLLPALYVVM